MIRKFCFALVLLVMIFERCAGRSAIDKGGGENTTNNRHRGSTQHRAGYGNSGSKQVKQVQKNKNVNERYSSSGQREIKPVNEIKDGGYGDIGPRGRGYGSSKPRDSGYGSSVPRGDGYGNSEARGDGYGSSKPRYRGYGRSGPRAGGYGSSGPNQKSGYASSTGRKGINLLDIDIPEFKIPDIEGMLDIKLPDMNGFIKDCELFGKNLELETWKIGKKVFGEDFDLGGKDKEDQNKDKGLLGGFEPLVAGVKSVFELRVSGRKLRGLGREVVRQVVDNCIQEMVGIVVCTLLTALPSNPISKFIIEIYCYTIFSE